MPVGVSAYVPLANLTIGSAQATITFSSISQSYRDLVLIVQGQQTTGSSQPYGRINGSANIYSHVNMFGNGTSTGSASTSSAGDILYTGNQSTLRPDGSMSMVVNFIDYSATNKHKIILSRAGSAINGQTVLTIIRAETTAAVSSFTISAGASGFIAGSTFALYGVSA
jgi:hypothetical protein